jgi:hypothetical protein
MREYAEVNRELGTVLRTRVMPELERDDGGNVVWLPLTREDQPPYDPQTQRLVQTVAIASNGVIFGWQVEDLPEPEVIPPTPEEIQAAYIAAIQRRLDQFARARGYDGILSACSYAASTDPQFAAEGQRCVELRDATWRTGYVILAEVAAGQRPIPTEAELMAELPALAWPE